MKQSFLLVGFMTALVACQKTDGDSTPAQTIVTSDSSNVTGRLYVDIVDGSGHSLSNAKATLYLSFDDIARGVPLYSFTSNSSGRVDFGYILEGNYYLTGVSSGGALHDTTVAQVLPKRVLTRKLILQ
jgi:hypothetical protein